MLLLKGAGCSGVFQTVPLMLIKEVIPSAYIRVMVFSKYPGAAEL
jgi:hypothetical protein